MRPLLRHDATAGFCDGYQRVDMREGDAEVFHHLIVSGNFLEPFWILVRGATKYSENIHITLKPVKIVILVWSKPKLACLKSSVLVVMLSCWYYVCVRWYITWIHDFLLLKCLIELNLITLSYLLGIFWHFPRAFNLYLMFVSYNSVVVLNLCLIMILIAR